MFCLALSANATKLTLAAMDYPPHYGEELKQNGPLIDLVVSVYQQQGYKVDVIFLPWLRALEWTKQGKVDGIIGIWHSQEREQFLLYSAPIYPNKMVFYKHRSRTIEFVEYKDLARQNLVLGSTRGYKQVKGLEESGIKINFVNNDIQNFKLLAKGRVDLLVADKDYAKYILATTQLQQIASLVEPMERVLETRQQFVAISKQAKGASDKLTDFNLGLQKLKQQGQLQAILSKHGIN